MKKILLALLLGLLLFSGCAKEAALPLEDPIILTPEAEEADGEEGIPEEEKEPEIPEEPTEPETTEEPEETPILPEEPEEPVAYSAEGPVVYTPKVGEEPKQLVGHIESEFYLCRFDRKEAIGVRSEDGETIKAILKKADDDGLWGDPYDDLPDYELWFADGRKLTYTSSSGIFTDNHAQKAFRVSEEEREQLDAIIRSTYSILGIE